MIFIKKTGTANNHIDQDAKKDMSIATSRFFTPRHMFCWQKVLSLFKTTMIISSSLVVAKKKVRIG